MARIQFLPMTVELPISKLIFDQFFRKLERLNGAQIIIFEKLVESIRNLPTYMVITRD